MQIQVHTDASIEGGDRLLSHVEAEIGSALSRFSDRLTRVEVHLGDENAAKSGGIDKRCMLEARPTGQQPVAVTHYAATVEESVTGAAQRLNNLLTSKFGRLDEHKGGDTIRDGERH